MYSLAFSAIFEQRTRNIQVYLQYICRTLVTKGDKNIDLRINTPREILANKKTPANAAIETGYRKVAKKTRSPTTNAIRNE